MPPLTAKPYLRSVHIDPRADIDPKRYPFNIPAVRDMGLLLPHPDVTFFVGENGTGISETAYEDTEHYAVTRDFLNHYPRRLEQLLGQED